jgi:hypothetical protein
LAQKTSDIIKSNALNPSLPSFSLTLVESLDALMSDCLFDAVEGARVPGLLSGGGGRLSLEANLKDRERDSYEIRRICSSRG